MSRQCIFCENQADSREHLWPRWIHERLKPGVIRFQKGTLAERFLPNSAIMVGTVCDTCNNGWMSDLEKEAVPIIGSMLQDICVPLNRTQLTLVAAWSVKTAMMCDSMKGRNAPNRFYSMSECVALRVTKTIPDLTRIWIGRADKTHLGAFGTDHTVVSRLGIRVGVGSVATIVAGHFVTQVATFRPCGEYTQTIEPSPKPGNWNNTLIPIWPIKRDCIEWPPAVPFTDGGSSGIAQLIDRWRVGERTEVVHM